MRKFIKIAAITAAIAVVGSIQAFAATYKIGTVNIGFSESSEEPGVVREAEPYVKTSDAKFPIGLAVMIIQNGDQVVRLHLTWKLFL